MQYFERSKLVPKIYDEQNIKFLSKDRIKTSATQSHVGATGKRKNHCDPEASSSLTSSCKRLIGSLQDLLRFHDWHTLITITLYWPKQVIGSTQFPGIGKKTTPLNGRSTKPCFRRCEELGNFCKCPFLPLAAHKRQHRLRFAFTPPAQEAE